MNTSHDMPLAAPQQARLLALALSAVFTLAMLLGIHTLAEVPDAAWQLAQIAQPRG